MYYYIFWFNIRRMNIAETIKILCVRRGISVAELSVRLGNSKQNLFNKLYRNDMKLSDVEKIAEALGADLSLKFIDKQTGEALA